MKKPAAPYILRADGRTHSADVRHVAFASLAGLDRSQAAPPPQPQQQQPAQDTHAYTPEGDVALITCSRDNTAVLSRIPVKVVDEADPDVGCGDEIVAQTHYVGHEAFVNFALLHEEGLDFLIRDTCRSETEESAVPHTPYLVTGSNDKHVLVWSLETTQLEAVLDGHQSGVTCGGVLRPCGGQAAPGRRAGGSARKESLTDPCDYHGDVVTGDWAGSILVFSHATGRVKAAYNKHENAIRGLVYIPGTTLVASVSGDKTLHCWDFIRLAQEGQNSLSLAGPVARVLHGHDDVVQCVCYVGDNRGSGHAAAAATSPAPSFYAYVATGSNDCTVRLWAVESQLRDAHPVKVLVGHDSLVYGVSFNASSRELLSASEDRMVRVWGSMATATDVSEGAATAAVVDDAFLSTFTAIHTVPHPCVVWSVAGCRVARRHHGGIQSNEEEDSGYEDLLLTGGSDGVTRLWTRNDENFASVEKLEALEEAIAAQVVDIKLIGGGGHASPFNMQTMPSVEQLHQFTGVVEGEKKFFKNDANEVEVYVWAGGRWEKMGTVVSENQPVSASSTGQVIQSSTGTAAKQRAKRMFKGKPYDYVFDVDINGRMLQLPYNAGESVLEAAQNFITEHTVLASFSEDSSAGVVPGVSQEHKEQIVSFIMDNIDQADIEKIPGLDKHASAPDHGTGAAPPLDEDQLWPTAELIETFSAEGAQRKASEFLAQSAPDKVATFSSLMSQLQGQLGLPAAADTDVPAAAHQLAELFAALPADKKFPALDAMRYAVAQTPHLMVQLLLALKPSIAREGPDGTYVFTYTPATDADALVLVRLVSNVVPALMTPQRPAVSGTAASYAQGLLVWALTEAMPCAAAVNAASSQAVRQALANFYMRNLSVLLRVALSRGECAGAEGRQAWGALQDNTDAAKSSATQQVLLQSMAAGFVAVLQPLLSGPYPDLVPLLLRSSATAAVELASSSATQPTTPAALTSFKEQLKSTLLAVPAAQSLVRALKL